MGTLKGLAAQMAFKPIISLASDDEDGKIFQVYANRWWVSNRVTGEILFCRGNPSCNKQKDIAAMLLDTYQANSEYSLELLFVPVALVDVTDSVWND